MQEIRGKEGVAENGLVAVLKTQEMGLSYTMFRSRGFSVLRRGPRKCNHYYCSWERRVHPLHAEVFRGAGALDHYGTAEQTEWATDIVFRDAESLSQLYQRLVRHGIDTFPSPDVLRFPGHRMPAHGGIHLCDLGRTPSLPVAVGSGLKCARNNNASAVNGASRATLGSRVH